MLIEWELLPAMMQLPSLLLEEKVPRRGGCGVAAQGGVYFGLRLLCSRHHISHGLRRASFSSRRSLLCFVNNFAVADGQQAFALHLPTCKGGCLAQGHKVHRIDFIGGIQIPNAEVFTQG